MNEKTVEQEITVMTYCSGSPQTRVMRFSITNVLPADAMRHEVLIKKVCDGVLLRQ